MHSARLPTTERSRYHLGLNYSQWLLEAAAAVLKRIGDRDS